MMNEAPETPAVALPEAPPPLPPPAPPYRTLTTLAELVAICADPVVVEGLVGAHRIRFEGRRLTPDEHRRVRQLLEQTLPPELPPETPGGEVRYNLRAPEFLARREENRRKARALALYWAFPLFGREEVRATPRPESEVVAVVEQAAVEDSLLDLAWDLVMREQVGVDPDRVGFTFGNSNPRS